MGSLRDGLLSPPTYAFAIVYMPVVDGCRHVSRCARCSPSEPGGAPARRNCLNCPTFLQCQWESGRARWPPHVRALAVKLPLPYGKKADILGELPSKGCPCGR